MEGICRFRPTRLVDYAQKRLGGSARNPDVPLFRIHTGKMASRKVEIPVLAQHTVISCLGLDVAVYLKYQNLICKTNK